MKKLKKLFDSNGNINIPKDTTMKDFENLIEKKKYFEELLSKRDDKVGLHLMRTILRKCIIDINSAKNKIFESEAVFIETAAIVLYGYMPDIHFYISPDNKKEVVFKDCSKNNVKLFKEWIAYLLNEYGYQAEFEYLTWSEKIKKYEKLNNHD